MNKHLQNLILLSGASKFEMIMDNEFIYIATIKVYGITPEKLKILNECIQHFVAAPFKINVELGEE